MSVSMHDSYIFKGRYIYIYEHHHHQGSSFNETELVTMCARHALRSNWIGFSNLHQMQQQYIMIH